LNKNYTTIPTKGFKKELGKLSDVERALVFAKIAILEDNPFYSSLRTKKMKIKGKSVLYESSVNMDIRFFWKFKDNKIILLANIGHHDVLRKY
jgi:mRNA-degrading endonuclease RelE of RelBE toxin-antitoxin system